MELKKPLASYIEHTLLKPDTTHPEVEQLCREALENHFAGVCVPAYFLEQAADLLQDSDVELVTVIGFPYGYNPTMSKFEEMEEAMQNGALHLDVVINIAAVKNGDWDHVETELSTLTRLAHSEDRIIKVIAETGLMSEVELDLIIRIANETGIDYLKTSTGVQSIGATAEAVSRMREKLKAGIRIKASGGIRTKDAALQFIALGADRIGTSSGIAIVSGGDINPSLN